MQLENLFKILIVTAVMSSCGEKSVKERTSDLVPNPEGEVKDKVGVVYTAPGDTAILGYYVGAFDAYESDEKKSPMKSNRINISIDSIKGSEMFGHSVVAGNKRPFKGSIKNTGASLYECKVKEPGDDKYDGEFSFDVNTVKHTATGGWHANDKNLPARSRAYELTKKVFKYDPSLEIKKQHVTVYNTESEWEAEAFTEDAGKFNASVKLLKSSDIDNMYKRDLEIMRNAIYARHGYSFKNRQVRDFFDTHVEWYIPVSIDVSKELTDVEIKNIALIKKYEKHADSYYDTFGR